MATYKTPDVYVEEISLLPPSVAEVETAIPAFIGYTEKHTHNGKPYKGKPKRISSLLEFQEIFGGAPPMSPTVTLDSVNGTVTGVNLGTNTYYLYDSLRLFFDNGGGKCYIVSVGKYGDPIAIGDNTSGLLGGLKALEKEDEPTIILSPDAVLLTDINHLASFQQQALKQSAKLMDRIAIFDLQNSGDHDADVQNFRDKVGINNLKYGAAYTPWLNTSYPKNIKYRTLDFLKGSSTEKLKFRSLTKDPVIRDYIDSLLDPSISAVDKLGEQVTNNTTLLGSEATLQDKFIALYQVYETASTDYVDGDATKLTALQNSISNLLKFNYDVALAIDSYYRILPEPGIDANATKYAFKLSTDLKSLGEDSSVNVLSQTSHQ